MKQRRSLSRRTFLRGLAGTAIALPLLEAGLGREALAQAASGSLTPEGFPKRFIYFFHPNGTQQNVFWPVSNGQPKDFQLSQILSPLEPFKSKLIIPKGLELKSGAGDVGPGEPHQRGMGTVLTGHPLQPGTFVGGDGSLAGWGNGISLDQVIAQHVGADTTLGSLQLGVRADTTAPTAEVRTRLSYLGAAQPLPPQNDPKNVFDQLFSDFMTAPAELTDVRARRKSVLDGVLGQFATLNKRAGAADRQRLEAHLEIVRDLEKRLENERVTGVACYAPDDPGVQVPDSEDTMPDIARLQMDLLVMAFACDITRVGGIQFSNAKNHIRFPWISSLGDGHQLSHAGPSNTEAFNEWVGRDTWFAQQFAYLLSALDSVPEGSGSMLDNTAVLWINELSQGNTHSHVDMPFVLAGSAGGYFDTGQFIEYGNLPHSNLLVSLQNAFGIEGESFGDERFCTGPLLGITR
ncbi:MAG: DUF1552 domain-containing protein [bacterium]